MRTKVTVDKIHTLTGHRDCVYTLEKTQFEDAFFSAAGDGMVALWNLQDPENGELIANLPNSIYGIHYSAQHNLLFVGHNYDGVHLLDYQEKKEIGSINMTTAAIFDIKTFGDHVFVAGGDGRITVMDISTLTILKVIEATEKSVRSLAVNPKKGELAAGFSDHTIRVYDLDGYGLRKEIKAHGNSVFTLKYSPDHQVLLSGGRDAHLKIWDAEANYLKIEEIIAHMYTINNIDFSPDGKHFVTCSKDKSVKVWDAKSFKLLKVIDKARHAGHGTSVNKLLWMPYHHQLVSASDDRTISVWDLQFEY